MGTLNISEIISGAAVNAVADAMEAGARVVASGAAGSSTAMVAGALAVKLHRPIVLITAHLDDADAAMEELTSAGVAAVRLPALEALPGETGLSFALLSERLAAVRGAAEIAPDGATVIACPIQALMQSVPDASAMAGVSRRLAVGGRCDPSELARWLTGAGYSRADAIEEAGDFAVRGGVMDVFPPGAEPPVRLDFFGDEIDRINEIDIETLGSDRAIKHVDLIAADEALARGGNLGFLELLPREACVVLSETLEIAEQSRGYEERLTDPIGIIPSRQVLATLSRFAAVAEVNQFSPGHASADVRVDLPAFPLPAFDADVSKAIVELAELGRTSRTVVCCHNAGELQRLGELLTEFSPGADLETGIAYVRSGFVWEEGKKPAAIVPYHEVLHRFHARRPGKLRSSRAIDTFLDFAPGDSVVHAEHGIARFVGLKSMKPARSSSSAAPAEPEEFLVLEFAKRSKLNVPAIQIDQVQKYVGGFKGSPPLSMLGGQKWQTQKARVFESVRGMASELLRVRAARESVPGIRFPADTPWQKEFEAEFPYEETEDQLAALVAIKRDMQQEKPMDRLLCGDVGFGKTEMAIRAAFKAAESGRQVAVLVPTTVLAEQHERTFRQRFADYPFRVESVSRFKSNKEINEVLASVRKGHVDVVIGTHRLLSQDVKFADLGLVVIDEEQRFGVEHKEKLLRFRMTADVLTLSATPIPRTLHMSLLGLRDISSLATPPADRQSVVTDVIPHDPGRIRQAIVRELSREGQVFYVHNRVHDIHSVADEIQKLVPDARIVIGHGQMGPGELEEVMLRFTRREADVLVSTTIIESGIDIPTANTMIIADSDRFGLADLHQLRGRVGRWRHRAYCYLLLPVDRTLKEPAKKRLKAIEQYSMLGAGFKIAMRDLEIRGAGNLLGTEQSGHIAAVGYDMYCRLLDRAVRELTNDRPTEPHGTSIEIGIASVIPKAYIPSDARRLDAYRRIAQATSAKDLESVERDLVAAYGKLPKQVERLLTLAALRLGAAVAGVVSITRRGPDIVLRTRDAKRAVRVLEDVKGTVRVPTVCADASDDGVAEVYFRPPENYLEPHTLLTVLTKRFGMV